MAWWNVFTEAEIQAHIDEYKAAITACLSGQSMTMEGRQIEMADLADLEASLQKWADALDAKQNGGIRIKRGIPVIKQ